MNFLLDTNFLVGILRGTQAYWDYLRQLLEQTAPLISAVTRAEIFAGCHPFEAGETERILGLFATVSIDGEIADLAGRFVYQFARRGVTLHLEDAMIGATAVNQQMILIMRDVDHFPMLSLGRNLIQFPTR